MLKFSDGRIRYRAFSFVIPDGFYFFELETRDRENYIKFMSPERDFILELSFIEDSASPIDELSELSTQMDMQVKCPPAPVQINGISGAHILYSSGRRQYYELWLKCPGQGAAMDLVIQTEGNIFVIDFEELVSSMNIRLD